MNDLQDVLKQLPWVTFGIVLSIVIPILRAQLPDSKMKVLNIPFKQYAKTYLIIAVFSMLTAFIILAFVEGQDLKWNGLLLAGYAWDSTIQKLVDKA